MGNKRSSQYIIVVILAFLALSFLFGLSAAGGPDLSLTAVENDEDYAIYLPVVANRLIVHLDGILHAADTCTDCCSLITVKNRGLVYELVPDESYTGDLASYDDFWVVIRGKNDGSCLTSGRPIFRVFDMWPVPPPF